MKYSPTDSLMIQLLD